MQFDNENKPGDLESYMLTTEDNPWSPFTQFDEWYAYDVAKGYCTCSYLARVIGYLDDSLDDYTNSFLVQKAIDEILEYNLTGNYRLVSRSDYDTD
jgi:hypothetical protein